METTKLSFRLSNMTIDRLKMKQSGRDSMTDVVERYINHGLDCAEQPVPIVEAIAKPNNNNITHVRETRSNDRATEEMKANYENAKRKMDEANAKEEDGPEEMFSTVGPTDLMKKYGDGIRDWQSSLKKNK